MKILLGVAAALILAIIVYGTIIYLGIQIYDMWEVAL